MVGKLQEWLQRHAPGRGMVCDQLYEPEFNQTFGGFQCRIILLNTTPQWHAAGLPNELPWGESQSRKREAKGDAAQVGLEWLKAQAMKPHDPRVVHTAPVLAAGGSGRGGDDFLRGVLGLHPEAATQGASRGGSVRKSDGFPTSVANTLPPLTADLLNVEMELCPVQHQPAGTHPAAADADGTLGASDSDSDDSDEGSGDGPWQQPESPNAGRLGEEFAAKWLASCWQCEVRWLNSDGEQHVDHDLEARRSAGEPWIHVEVKTRWRGCKLRRSQLSRRQLRRLLDPDDDHQYAVLVIGDTRNLFADPPRPPARIRMHGSAALNNQRLPPGAVQARHRAWCLAHSSTPGPGTGAQVIVDRPVGTSPTSAIGSDDICTEATEAVGSRSRPVFKFCCTQIVSTATG